MAPPMPQTKPNSAPSAKTLRNRRRRAKRAVKIGNGVLVKTGNGLQPAAAVVRRSPADPKSFYAYDQLGNTEGGRLAAVKILHPNGENDNYSTKFPDGFANSSINMQRRDEFNVPKPPTLPAGGIWNAVLVEVPQLVGNGLAMVFSATLTPTSQQMQQVYCEAMVNVASTASVYPNFYNSVTLPGIYYSWLQSDVLSGTIAGTENGIGIIAKSVRRTCYGITVDLNAPTLASQGRVTAGQWSPDITTSSRPDTEDPPQVWPVYDANAPALVDTEIVQSDPQSVQHEAVDGLYMPIRVCGDVDFTPAVQWRHTNWTVANTESEDFTKDDDSYDIVLNGWMIGVSAWNGLSDQATLRVKRHECLELVSAPKGIYAAFADRSLPSDERAISIIREFARNEPHAYPASYNELGTMLQKLIGGIGNALGNLGIPLISKLASTVGNVATGKVGDTVAGLLDHIF